MKSKFQFYEVVTVIKNNDDTLDEIIGEEGTILGMAQDETSHQWSYGVLLTQADMVWQLDESCLRSTGKIKKRADFYSGDSIRVDSNGNIIEWRSGENEVK